MCRAAVVRSRAIPVLISPSGPTLPGLEQLGNLFLLSKSNSADRQCRAENYNRANLIHRVHGNGPPHVERQCSQGRISHIREASFAPPQPAGRVCTNVAPPKMPALVPRAPHPVARTFARRSNSRPDQRTAIRSLEKGRLASRMFHNRRGLSQFCGVLGAKWDCPLLRGGFETSCYQNRSWERSPWCVKCAPHST
jgi:hypothetical protein